MGERLVAVESAPLLETLARHFTGWSRNTLRQRLRLGCVTVNGSQVDRQDHLVQGGDVVEVEAKSAGRAQHRMVARLPTLFEDADLIAIDKPVGLLSVSTDGERDRTALAMVREMISRPGRAADLWPVHRLDRETSGVLLFARSRSMRDRVQAAWSEVTKTYVAIVAGIPAAATGTIDQPLWEDDNLRVHVGPRTGARPARTRYRLLQRGRDCSLLEVELDSGRKHQIRAHLAWLGHPIVGDDRYGTAGGRLALHALRLELRHPVDGRSLRLEAAVPTALLQRLR